MMRTVNQDVWDEKKYLVVCAEGHPRAQIQDYVKRLHQSEFGSDCRFDDEAKAMEELRLEIGGLTDKMKRRPWFDPFCGDYCRLSLSVSKEISPELIYRICKVSDRKKPAEAWFRFEERLRVFRELCKTHPELFRFTVEELEEYLKVYREQGYPSVKHSETYMAAYEPAYRVARKEYARNIELYAAIEKSLREKGSVTVAIDGNCGAGKTELAKIVADLWDCNVIHADSFFLPLEKRTPERMAEVGGNMERERLRAEVLEPLKTGKPFAYRPFDCTLMEFSDPVEIQPKAVNIIEGSYCMHPELREYYDVTVFLGINPTEQEARILARNGSFMLRRYLDEWIPKENEYFEKMKVREACQIFYE